MIIGYKVGMRLWLVPSYSSPHEVVVTTVGRKWVGIDVAGRLSSGNSKPYYRVEIGSRHLDGGQHSSPGTLYLSQEAHRISWDVNAAWRALQNAVTCGGCPEDVTLGDIAAARRLLRKEPT